MKINIRSLSLYLLSFMLQSCLLTSCDHGEEQKLFRIGVSQCSGGHWRQKQNNEMLRELLLQEQATLEIRCADDQEVKQIEDIQYFMDNHFDIIVVSPNTAAALTDVIAKAYRKGIPVLLFDRVVNGDQFTAFVGGDNLGVGQQQAAYISKRLQSTGGRGH